MHLLLIRHGDALSADQDAARPLSPQGRADVVKLAERLRADEAAAPVAIWHSPYRRARETAALLAQHAGRQVMLIGKSYLTPDDDPAKIARLLAELPPAANLAIVGHEPHLTALATLLTTGRASPVQFTLEKAGVIALTPAEGKHETTGFPRWKVRE
jgi:phosphohistidine phosphatase